MGTIQEIKKFCSKFYSIAQCNSLGTDVGIMIALFLTLHKNSAKGTVLPKPSTLYVFPIAKIKKALIDATKEI